MAAHAKLSASGAHRWLNCPGSVKLEEGFSDTTSVYAKEGTLAHDVSELKLQKYFVKGVGPKTFQKKMAVFKKSEFWGPEMDKMTDVYFDEVKRKALEFKSTPFVNIEERVDFSDWVPEGFGTADCIMVHGSELVVMDLKYGKGVPVSVENNPQLLLYALGAYANYSWIYDIQKVTLCIVQPRLNNIDYWTIDTAELLTFGDKVRPIAEEAFNGSDRFKEGDHCRFCKAKSVCGERAANMFDVVQEVKPFIKKKGRKHEIKGLLTADQIGEFLTKCKGVTEWIKDLQEEALAQILAGTAVPGYKAVEGRSNRRIVDEAALARVLMDKGFEESVLYKPPALETLTNLEKLVGKKEFGKIGKDLIVKPQGKPTLVPESDKRPPYKKDAASMFEQIETN